MRARTHTRDRARYESVLHLGGDIGALTGNRRGRGFDASDVKSIQCHLNIQVFDTDLVEVLTHIDRLSKESIRIRLELESPELKQNGIFKPKLGFLKMPLLNSKIGPRNATEDFRCYASVWTLEHATVNRHTSTFTHAHVIREDVFLGIA
ncbi:hypothetical protein EVAR_79185_1 [Eumeta japonica]|uniref:Uncharacterized protein n=1 Tax=Eumeta variegata TaxID=151549 RepID=A0A4C1UUH6_EUMVA|nr:hypothetical protein EVAR_79185_1 [Eumeta japonica]